jgi:hypothetical protein
MKNRFAMALCALLLVAGAVLAQQITQETYRPVRTAARTVQTAHRTAVDGTDAQYTFDTPIDLQYTNGDPTIVVAPRWSDAGATAWVSVGLYSVVNGTATFSGIAFVQTLTASSGIRGAVAGKYSVSGLPMIVDSLGFDAYDVRYHDVSGSGTVDSYAHTIGATSRAAE